MPGSQRELWGSRREGRAEPFAGEQPRVTGSGAPSPPLPAQDALLECVTRKVPVLLSRGMARLVVIDSVAAPFRCEFDAQASVPRARRLQALGAALRRLSHAFQSPVLCINQVTDTVEEQDTAPGLQGSGDMRASPALGTAWANQLLLRLMADRRRGEEAVLGGPARTLRVLFSPHLPPSSCAYTIHSEGVRGTPGTEPH